MIKEVKRQGNIGGRIYLPKRYVGVLVNIIPVSPEEQKAYIKKKKEYEKAKRESEKSLKKLRENLNKLREEYQDGKI